MENEALGTANPNHGSGKSKIVVILGATGTGKSRLAIDLASHFPVEIINADSMQVYKGLDVLTNKVPLEEQKGVSHHLLGTVSPEVEFTAKDFRDSAIPLIDEILSRGNLPVIVGGTNYYIQALVSRFLLDDSVEDTDEDCLSSNYGGREEDPSFELAKEKLTYSYDCLKDLDPIAANRIHPNDQRKINQYLGFYDRFGVLPSKLLQGKAMENWGRADNCRYNCCFVCVDASLPVVDKYVEQRVDCMVDAGLLNEVYDIYNMNADYTRGLLQAIGVREFEDFLKAFLLGQPNSHDNDLTDVYEFNMSANKDDETLKASMSTILKSADEKALHFLLKDAIEKVKMNTRRLVRRQKRRINRLETLFGWKINYFDATESFLSGSDDIWNAHVVEPAARLISSYLTEDDCLLTNPEEVRSTGIEGGLKSIERDLWTQYVCKACGNRVLRGAHEWEQHKQGRGHRKRICSLRKTGIFLE